MEYIFNTRHSTDFIESWKKLLTKLYGYKSSGNMLIVPGLTGKKTYSYLPLLNYTDMSAAETDEMIMDLKGKNYQIRTLDTYDRTFINGETVTMRVPIRNQNSIDIHQNVFSYNLRKQLKKAGRQGFEVTRGNSQKSIDDFYLMFSRTMGKFGTPVFSKSLFNLIPDYTSSLFYNIYFEGRPVAAMLIIYDKGIAWCPWSGSDASFVHLRPSYKMFMEGICDACDKNLDIFDFGRSSYGNVNFDFKSRWNAVPVKINIFRNSNVNIYQKYSLASSAYKMIPEFAALRIGPILSKYLEDF